MADIVFVAIIVTFFGLATLLVRLCERLIGPAEGSATDRVDDLDDRDDETVAVACRVAA